MGAVEAAKKSVDMDDEASVLEHLLLLAALTGKWHNAEEEDPVLAIYKMPMAI